MEQVLWRVQGWVRIGVHEFTCIGGDRYATTPQKAWQSVVDDMYPFVVADLASVRSEGGREAPQEPLSIGFDIQPSLYNRVQWRTVLARLITLDGFRHKLFMSVLSTSTDHAIAMAQIHWEETHQPEEDYHRIHPPTIFDPESPALCWLKEQV